MTGVDHSTRRWLTLAVLGVLLLAVLIGAVVAG